MNRQNGNNEEHSENMITELLEIIAFNVVAKKRGIAILKQLFHSESGEWCHLADIIEDYESLYENVIKINKKTNDSLVVTWIPHPTDYGYGLILFYLASFAWSSVASYNIDYLKSQE